ncbi:hypothetical protein ACFVR2_22900 [Gottfriedia sp. NPDC057991]|uniref:hypothetical protein n=1 Tax=Gottfriedia sp. NPDC057991 TaxID=3346298 RepID=UPI0036D7F98D
MKKIHLLWLALIILIAVGGFIVYQKIQGDPHEGMSVIPEQRKDIGLYKKLELKDGHYVVKRNHLKEIHNFYLKDLQKSGWELEYDEVFQSGFMSRWTKPNQGKLNISGGYSHNDNQTEIRFDLYFPPAATTWFSIIPITVEVMNENKITEKLIKNKNKINQLINFINEDAYDTKEKPLGELFRYLKIDDVEIKIYYKKNGPIFFVSEKGTKMMKPEKEIIDLLR